MPFVETAAFRSPKLKLFKTKPGGVTAVPKSKVTVQGEVVVVERAVRFHLVKSPQFVAG